MMIGNWNLETFGGKQAAKLHKCRAEQRELRL